MESGLEVDHEWKDLTRVVLLTDSEVSGIQKAGSVGFVKAEGDLTALYSLQINLILCVTGPFLAHVEQLH